MKANSKLSFKMLFTLAALISITSSVYAWDYFATGPWASFNFGEWTVYQNAWGAQDDYTCELYANNASNWACRVSYTGDGIKNYCHVQGNPNIEIGSTWCTSGFGVSVPDNAEYTAMYDLWTAGMQDELMVQEYRGDWGGGTWGTQIASWVTISGRLYESVWQANNGSNNVIIFTPASRRKSGDEDLMAYFVWCRDRGLLHNNTFYELSFGFEITATDGWQQFTSDYFWADWGSGGCTPTPITPYIQVDGGSWQQTSSVTVNSGSTVKFGPQPVSGGSWSWTGCGTSGTSREQTITAYNSCTATATYTNTSGCQSTQDFNVTVNSSAAYVKIQNKATGLYVDGMGRTSNGSNAGQWSNSSSYNQQWTMETSSGYARFKNRATGLYLDGMGRTSNGSLVGQWDNSNSNNQQWTVEDFGSYKRIKNRATGLYIDGMYWYSNGSDLGQWSNSGSDGQQWTISELRSAEANPGEFSTIDKENCGVILSPNPFTSEINISIEDPEKVTGIIVLDVLGKQVQVIDHSDVKNVQVIGSSLKAGIYVVQVCSSNKMQSFKILKK